jgi:hypothetical protein
MAETPKAENESGKSVTGAEAGDTVVADTLSGAASDSLTGGTDSLSDGVSGAAGRDSLAGTPAVSPSPWAASADPSAGDPSDPADTPADKSAEKAAEKPAGKSGGAGRLIVIVLIGGVGYATYPEWREEAVPYARMIGVTLPEVPVETDPDAPAAAAPAQVAPGSEAAPSAPAQPSTASSDSAPSSAPAAPVAGDTDAVSVEAFEALAERLAAAEAEIDRLSALEAKSASPSVTAEDVSALSSRIERLEKTSEGGDADLIARLDALTAAQTDLAGKVARGRDKQEQAGAFLLAANLLAAASSDSGGYVAELDAVETAALDQPDVAEAIGTLKGHAGGVPSATDLRVRFPAVAAAVIDASIVGADDGVVGTVLTRIAALVTLRRTETAEGDALDAIVNRAEAAANAGDLPAAVEALAALDGDPAKVAAPWIAEAKARIAVDRAVRTLQARALATLSGG